MVILVLISRTWLQPVILYGVASPCAVNGLGGTVIWQLKG